MSHIGYAIYEEGNALLSKCPLTSEALLISESQEPTNYRTRKILVARQRVQRYAYCCLWSLFLVGNTLYRCLPMNGYN